MDVNDYYRFADDLGNASGGVGRKVAAVVRKTANDITRTARYLAPVDTGNLRSSISSTITGDGRTRAMTAEIGPTADYGAYVEHGTSRMTGQPYLFPATSAHEAAYLAALEQAATPEL